MVLHYFHLVPHLPCDVQTPDHNMFIPVLSILACCLCGSLSNSFQHNLHCHFLDQHPKATLSYRLMPLLTQMVNLLFLFMYN